MRTALALAIVLIAGCRGRGDAPPAADSVPVFAPAASIAPAPAGSFAAIAAQELTALRQPVTLRAWLRAHTADFRERNADVIGSRCAIAVSALRLESGALALRRALFYVPMPDSSLDAPADSIAETDLCVLGAISVALAAPVGTDTALTQAIAEMHRVFGDAIGSWDAINWFGDRAAQWRTEGIALAGGRVVHYQDINGHEGGDGIKEDTLRVIAVLPIASETDGLAMANMDDYAAYDHPTIVAVNEIDRECNINEDSVAQAVDSVLRAGGTIADSNAAALHFLAADGYYASWESGPDSNLTAAMRHYRAGLALDRNRTFPGRKRALWNLWRLEAGLQPRGSVFMTSCGDG